MVAAKVEFTRIGRMLQAALMIAYAIPTSGVTWTAAKALALILMITCASLVFFALFVIYAAFAFFTIEGLEFMNILLNGGMEFGRYPYSVYGKHVLALLTFVVPLALVQYYPLLFLLDVDKNPALMLVPLASLLFLLPAFAFFRFGLKHYRSTGS